MLKIREGVDLKELEKFGFEDNNGYLIKSYKQEFSQDDYIKL